METTESVFARNVAQLRTRRQHTVRSLADVLAKLGRPMHPSGVTKLENGTRHPGPADLVALALALGATPNRLLFPVDDRKQDVAITPTVTALQFQAWAWAQAQQPLFAASVEVPELESPPYLSDNWFVALADFRRDALPDDELARRDHTAMRAASDVVDGIRAVLDRRENPDDWAREDELRAKRIARGRKPFGPDRSSPAQLRNALKRLNAEVDALIGVDDGKR